MARGTRRCSTCAINFPQEVMKCKVCGGHVDWISNDDPHEDWKDRVAEATGKETEDGYEIKEAGLEPRVVQWRERSMLNAGFDGLHAAILAPLRRIDLHTACDLVQAAGSDMAFRILH